MELKRIITQNSFEIDVPIFLLIIIKVRERTTHYLNFTRVKRPKLPNKVLDVRGRLNFTCILENKLHEIIEDLSSRFNIFFTPNFNLM